VELARIAEHQAFDSEEAGRRRLQAYAIGGASVLAGLITLLLAVTGSSTVDEQPIAQLGLSPRPSESARPEIAVRSSDSEEGVVSHARSTAASAPAPRPEPGAVVPVFSVPRTSVVLKTAAELATDLGRVRNPEELERLLGRTADLLDAAGLVVWVGAADAAGESLRPVLAHGYTPQILARMAAVPYTADNAAAAAYRTGTLQVVQSRAGTATVAPGAIVAPILGTDGCIGALSAEIKNGGEGSEAVQAVAAIVAAQLAGILAVTSVETEAPEMRTATAG
jgi:hypothetical protein